MINSIINILENVFLRHKGVKTFRYQAEKLNNAQNNYEDIQVYVEDVSYHNLNITTNIFTSEFEIYILQPFSSTQEQVIEAQTNCMTVAIDVIGYIDNDKELQNKLNIHDYSIITMSHYTTDDSAGVKLSLTFEIPSILNLCDLDSNFNDEPYEQVDKNDNTIDLGTSDSHDNEITLKQITL